MYGIEPIWYNVLKEEIEKPYFHALKDFVKTERNGNIPIYPPHGMVFNALNMTPFNKVKVLIMGQDPYHGPGQAHGLSFSVPKGVVLPPSLKNIYKELISDVNMMMPSHGCLEQWAEQGVLLLNATLTVREGQAMSHHGKGWEIFTDAIIKKLAGRNDPVIFVLWGKNAEKKCLHVTDGQHKVLKAPHPSPLSAHQGFLGCKHFSSINSLLIAQNKIPIDWQIN